jgi:hypothetical protein
MALLLLFFVQIQITVKNPTGVTMELIVVLFITLVLITIAAVKMTDQGFEFPFAKRNSILTPAERGFLALLEKAVGNEYRIISRVRLTDMVSVRKGTSKRLTRAALVKANGRYLDYVLCDKNDIRPIAAIDLVNNVSREGYKSKKDWFISGVLDAASIPHIRIKVKAGYKPEEIRACIKAKLAPINYKNPEPALKSRSAHKTPSKNPPRHHQPVAA